MLQIPTDSIILLLAIVIVYTFFYWLKTTRREVLDKYGISIESFAIFIRTKKLNNFIINIGQKYRTFWKIISIIGIIVSFYLMGIGLLFIHQNLIGLLFRTPTASPVKPLIPGITIGIDSLPYFVIAFLLVLIPHEFFHGFIASSENINIRSAGLFFFTIFFGGFVEPDENEFNASSLLSKIRVYAAGSFANFLTYLLLLVLFLHFVHPNGVTVVATLPGYPAYNILQKNDIIIKMNNTPIDSIQDLTEFMKKTQPSSKVVIVFIREGHMKNVTLILKESPSNSSQGFIGIRLENYYDNKFLYYTLWWSLIITSSVAVINMLPIIPFDGGQIISNLLEYIFKKRHSEKISDKISYLISIYVGLILILNILLSFNIWGFGIGIPP